ncbi:MAG: ABC transporter permease, partial [Verrucomicrobia bacterium]
MKRFLLAAAFFAALLLLWEAAFRARIWSPVLLPSPWQVASYLKNAAVDGTL